MSQSQMIVDYMKKHGSITPIEALHSIGCFRLAARIQELRESGYAVNTEKIKENGKSFARYSLA